MLRFLPYNANENEGIKGENGVESTNFGGKLDVNLYNNEDINAKESDDGIYKEYYYYDVSHDYDDDHDDEEEEDDSDDDDDEDDRYDDDKDDDHDHDHDEEDVEEDDEEDDAHAHDQDDIRISDCESSASVNKLKNIVDSIDIQPEIRVDRLIRLNENDRSHKDIKTKFISAMEAFGVKIQLEHIDMNVFEGSPISETRMQTFLSYKRAVNDKTGGHANVTRAWFVASKDQINHIILHGFSYESIQKNGSYGCGLYLSTDASVVESLKSYSVAGDDEVRHILLCSVILGKLEVVKHGSKQCYPQSNEFQTGVDNLQSPKKYVVWSAYVNTHVLPEYVVSFKTVSGFNEPIVGSVSNGVPISELVSGLSKIVLPANMKKILEYYHQYIEHKISRRDMLDGFKDSAGERLLWMAMKIYHEQKQVKEKVDSSPIIK